MKTLTYLLVLVSCISLWGEDIDQFEKRTGLKGTYLAEEKVYKVSLPRSDIVVSIDGFKVDPFMGLTSWAAFTPFERGLFVVMGDLVLFEDEVNPVMTTLLDSHVDVTALHNHFFFDQPKVYFMHIGGFGSLETLSKGVKSALETVKQIRSKLTTISTRFENMQSFGKNEVSIEKLESIFGVQGQAKEGMAKFVFGRKVKMQGLELGQEMGVNTWAAFGGTLSKARVDGDFAVTEMELQPVLMALRKGNINVVAIHNHMTMEQPRMIFLHYWGEGKADELAKTLNAALKLTR